MCSKVRYESAAEAGDVLVAAKIRYYLHGNKKRREARVYECPDCSGFHLTSRETTA